VAGEVSTLPDVLLQRIAPIFVLASLAAASPAGANDRYDLKVKCNGQAMVATVTGPKIKQVTFTTTSSRAVVRRAPWTAAFARAGKVIAKAKLTGRDGAVVRLEAKSPRC
jgi:hypothetical protein